MRKQPIDNRIFVLQSLTYSPANWLNQGTVRCQESLDLGTDTGNIKKSISIQ
jgi:hypothetical protein